MSLYFNKKIFFALLVLLAIFSIFGFVSKAEATTSGPNNPVIGTDDSSVGTISWSNPGNIISSNNSNATASLNDNQISHYLKATNFGFAIPSGATINGITVEVEKKSASASRIKDYRVRIIKGGTISVTDKSNANWWGTSDAYTTYGSISDLWGETWTPSDINNTNFGLALSAYKNTTQGNAITASVDHIRITINYTIPTFTLSYTAGANGVIVGTTLQTVNYGASGTAVIASPDLGYHFTSWSDGVLTAIRTDVNVTANISVVASFAVNENPVPVITFLSPSSKNVGDSNLILTVNGTNFVSGSVVNFNGSSRTTTYIDNTQLTVTILTSDLSSTGNINVTVFNSTPGGGTSNIQTLSIVNPVPTTTSLSSASKISGDAEFTMTVNGTNFISSSVVNFAGSARVTSYVSSTELTATIPATDLITAGTFDITVLNGTPGGGTSNAQTFTVIPGLTNHFTLNHPGSMHVGSRAMYTVSRFDAHNNAVTSGDLTVYLYHNLGLVSTTAFYDSAIDGAVITSLVIANGSSSNNFYLYSNDTGDYNINVTVSDGTPIADGNTGIIDITDTISVSAAPISATRFVISDPVSTVVGVNASIEVKMQDGAGNIDTSYNGSVTLHTSPTGPGLTPGGIVTITSGIGAINIVDTKAEVVSLALEDTAGSGLDVSSTKNITFTPGPTAKFIMTGASSAVAGDRITYSISRKDQYDNNVTSGVDTIHLYNDAPVGTANFYDSLSGGASITSISILEGSNSTNVYLTGTLVGSLNIYASDNPVFGPGIIITNGTSLININPASVSSFIVEASGGGNISTKTVGTSFDISITAKDTFGNIATGFIGTADISSSGTLSSGGGTTPAFVLGVLSSRTVNISNVGLFTITATRTGGTETGISNSFTVATAPIVATKFKILDPLNVQVGQTTIVTIEAVDDLDNRADTFNGNINLVTSGSATGAGLVNIVNGIGTKNITDSVVETVDLSLSDVVPPTTLDFSATSDVVFSAIPPVISLGGGGGVSGAVTPTVSFSGRAFPDADIEIMAIREGEKVPVSASATGGASGNFNVKYNGMLPSGVNSFALVVYDKNQNIAQTKVFTLGVNDKLIKTILMAPTVDLIQSSVTRGTFMGITGQAMPGYKIGLMIDGVKTGQMVTADNDGNYNITYNTFHLDLGTHTLRVRQVDTKGNASDYSLEKRFLIINTFVPKADLNGDAKVDIQDWGIFMARYSSTDTKLRQSLDMNNDGKVDSADLSIFIGALNSQF
ncbi:MAG: dockerin type I domain-containing protein [Candidatus Paceibacterota bacterium]|jgi:hypothetical protein